METFIEKNNLYFDSQRQGFDSSFWTTLSGTPALNGSNNVQFTSASAIGTADISSGDVTFYLKVPTDPTAGQTREWGLVQLNSSAAIKFRISGTTFSVYVSDINGNANSTTLTWLSSYTSNIVKFTIRFSAGNVEFWINGIKQDYEYSLGAPNAPMSLYVNNAQADALELSHIEVKNAQIFLYANPLSHIAITDGTNTAAVEAVGADAVSNTQNNLAVTSKLKLFNGTTWDRARSGGVSVVSAVTGFQNVLPMAVYHASPSARSDGQAGPVESDSSGNIQVNMPTALSAEDFTDRVFATALRPSTSGTYSWSRFQNLGANATLNVKPSPGSVKSIYCHNLAALPTYIQIHKTATTPSGGAVPELSFLVPPGGVTCIDGSYLGENGYYCTTGIAFAYSTTEATYTAGTAANQMTHIMYA